MAAALQIWSPTFCRVFDSLPPRTQQQIQDKIDSMGLRLDAFPHHALPDALNTACASATIASFTRSIFLRVEFTCFISAIAAKSIRQVDSRLWNRSNSRGGLQFTKSVFIRG